MALIISILISSLTYYLLGYFNTEPTFKIKQVNGIYECIKCEKKNTEFSKIKKPNGRVDIYITCNNCIRGWKITEDD